jgi:hypothetical protein
MRKSYLYYWGLVVLLLAGGNIGQAQDSLGMRCVSNLDYWATVDGIQMVGDMAYVVSGNKFHIVSLADPANPVEVGQASWSDYWGGMSICVVGNLAYVNPGYGVIVYDVSDPAHLMTLTDWQPWPGCEVEQFLVLGDIAIMKVIDDALFIVDISDLGNIHIVGGNFPPEPSCPVMPVGMVGEYLCLRGVGLSMWDISDPTLPVKVAEIDTQFIVGGATLSGNYAYAGTWADGLRIIDISNPLQPFEVASCDSGDCRSVTVTVNYAIILSNGAITIWNVANPAQPVFESSFGPQISFSHFLASSGNLIGAGDLGGQEPSLLIVDITNPQAPVEISTFGTKGFFDRMTNNGTVGYLAGGYSTLHTIDLSNPAQAVMLGMSEESPYSASAYDVAIRGNYAYTACGTQGFLVFDISNSVQPDFVMAINYSTDNIMRLVTAGDYLYVSDSYHHILRIYNLSNPAAPEYIDSITCYASQYCGFMAADGYLYFGINNNFSIYSLSNPTSPQLVGSCNLSGGSYILDLAPTGNYIYVAYEIGGLRVIDISDPIHPTVVGSVAENTWSVAVSGNTLITFGPDGLRAKDITDRLHPVTVGYYYYPNATDQWIRDIDVLGQYLLTISSGYFRVFQYDTLSSTLSPPEIIPSSFTLYPCYPNPFNTITMIRFSLPYTAHTKLTIYDVTGRQVKVLANEMLDAGEHCLTFDGSGLSSGVYFVRLQSGQHTQTEKMVLLK